MLNQFAVKDLEFRIGVASSQLLLQRRGERCIRVGADYGHRAGRLSGVPIHPDVVFDKDLKGFQNHIGCLKKVDASTNIPNR